MHTTFYPHIHPLINTELVLISCCSVAKSCPTLFDPMDCSTPAFPVLHCSTPAFPVLHYLPEFAQTHVL